MLGKTVYLVRHGQSDDNVAPVFQAYDSPLSPEGKEQAERLASRIQHLDFEVLISSPQERAKQTTDVIALRTSTQVEMSNLFVERTKPTSISGKPYRDAKAHSTWLDWQRSLSTTGHKVEDGENFEDMIARADEALNYLQNRDEKHL